MDALWMVLSTEKLESTILSSLTTTSMQMLVPKIILSVGYNLIELYSVEQMFL